MHTMVFDFKVDAAVLQNDTGTCTWKQYALATS